MVDFHMPSHIYMLVMFKFIDICSCSYTCQRKQKSLSMVLISLSTLVAIDWKIVAVGLYPTDHMQHDKID